VPGIAGPIPQLPFRWQVTKEDFGKLAGWKRAQKKRELGLFCRLLSEMHQVVGVDICTASEDKKGLSWQRLKPQAFVSSEQFVSSVEKYA
jgi:hypothetical protein